MKLPATPVQRVPKQAAKKPTGAAAKRAAEAAARKVAQKATAEAAEKAGGEAAAEAGKRAAEEDARKAAAAARKALIPKMKAGLAAFVAQHLGWLAVGAYVVVVAAAYSVSFVPTGYYFSLAWHTPAKTSPAKPASMLAALDIHRNALVRAGDIAGAAGTPAATAAAALAGKYATAEIHTGAVVTAAQFQAAPTLASTPGERWLGFPAPRAQVDSGDVNGGRSALLCSGAGPPLPVEVDTVVCPASKAAGCTALLRLEPADAARAAELVKAGGQVAAACNKNP